MDSSSLFGIELGKLVLSSGILHSSWSKISEIPNQDSGLGVKIFPEAKYTLVVFTAPPLSRNGSSDSASTLLSVSQDQHPFHFLCSEKISEFSVHSRAYELFSSAYEDLCNLKKELLLLLESKKHVIITGAALGGSVASLFTLWLLETIEPGQNRPLCITFGSPLIGDDSLQKILENSVRNSCFLHVVDAAQNPQNPITASFKPFGTFLICYNLECICVEDPNAVMKLLVGVNTDLADYGEILHRLDQPVSSMADLRLIPDVVINQVKECAENKKPRYDPSIKLNDMKILMMYFENYKKRSKEAQIGYYDRYKTQPNTVDRDMMKRKTELNIYWKSMVKEGDKKPQSEISFLSRRYLYAGNNYRRIIEPLDIAEYYRKGLKEYSVKGRSHHYVMLEKWFQKESIKPAREGRDLSDLLTFDSCFWAEVEETMIVINSLKEHEGMRDETSMGKLVDFEKYVWELIKNREVSPEIFLENSSFMKWWKEYKEISSPSNFTEFMNTGEYKTYGHGSN